mmetsp:Transcript_17634/g.31882  ORF Transcript_17634/g.31882 Transcript_17634/m.31882 type:complete len:1185 (-) Transcript_17634:219-3773(-)
MLADEHGALPSGEECLPLSGKTQEHSPATQQNEVSIPVVNGAVEGEPPADGEGAASGHVPLLVAPRGCGYGGMLCELSVLSAVQEYLDFHSLNDTSRALSTATQGYSGSSLSNPPGGAGPTIPENGCKDAKPIQAFPETTLLGSEFVVAKILADFDAGRKDEVFATWQRVVPLAAAQGQVGSAVELRLHVYFGTFRTRQALLEAGPGANIATVKLPPEAQPNFDGLKAFLSSQPSNAMDQSSDNLAPLFVLPFVPEPQQRPGLKFIFEESWVLKLRGDLAALVVTHAVARHAPAVRHLAGNLIVPKATGPPPPASWHELVKIADKGLVAASSGMDMQGNDGPKVARKGEWLDTLLRTVTEARACLAALAANPSMPPPAPRHSAQGLRSPSGEVMQGVGNVVSERVGSGVLLAADYRARWPASREVALREGSASSLRGIRSPQKRISSARSLESRARTATAPLPVPPALDFGQIAAVIAGVYEQQGPDADDAKEPMPPIHAVLWAVLRRLASPDEPLRPRRTFLAAFACFGGPKALAQRLPEISVGGDAALTEMSLAVLAVCSCEAVGRKEIELAEAETPGCIKTLIDILGRERLSSPVQMQCLAVLQRLSLRRALQMKMIELGAIDWILQTLKRIGMSVNSDDSMESGPMLRHSPSDTMDFSLEFASALLMNLTLRTAGRRRCMTCGGCSTLVCLIEHPNPQVRTHVNGTLYSLLGVRRIRMEAREQGIEELFRAALVRVTGTDELLCRQLEYLIMQLKLGGGSSRTEDQTDEGTVANKLQHEKGEIAASDSDHSEAEAEGSIPEDDGDNFLHEEELAGQFLLVSPVDMMGNATPAAALAQSVSPEAAGSEEVLRRFRATPTVADTQQHRFHAFIISSCSGSIASPKRPIGRQQVDALGGRRVGMLPASPPLPALPQSRSGTPGFIGLPGGPGQHLAQTPEGDEAGSRLSLMKPDEAVVALRVGIPGGDGASAFSMAPAAANPQPKQAPLITPRLGAQDPSPRAGAAPVAKAAAKKGAAGSAPAAKASAATPGQARSTRSGKAAGLQGPTSKPPPPPGAVVGKPKALPQGVRGGVDARMQYPPVLPSVVGQQAHQQSPPRSPGRGSVPAANQAVSHMADGVVAVGAGQRPRKVKNIGNARRDQAEGGAAAHSGPKAMNASKDGSAATATASLPQLPRITQRAAP